MSRDAVSSFLYVSFLTFLVVEPIVSETVLADCEHSSDGINIGKCLDDSTLGADPSEIKKQLKEVDYSGHISTDDQVNDSLRKENDQVNDKAGSETTVTGENSALAKGLDISTTAGARTHAIADRLSSKGLIPANIEMTANSTTVSAMKNAFYSLRPLTSTLGAEVMGVDLKTQDFSPDFISQIKRDMTTYRVLLFKKQDLTGERQVDFSSKLGKIESTFYKHPRSPHPDIFRVSNDEQEGCTNVGRTGWHVDGTFMETPFMFQTMFFPSVAEGGDTYFIGLKELYEAQPDDVKKRWDRLWMVTGRRQAPIHPLVYKHPFRGDTTMVFHCGESFVSGWLEDTGTSGSGGEPNFKNDLISSRKIQNELTEAIEKLVDQYGIRMKWEAGDFTINDNLGLAHYACPGTQGDRRKVGLRILHRTTVIGGSETIPVKFDGRGSFAM